MERRLQSAGRTPALMHDWLDLKEPRVAEGHRIGRSAARVSLSPKQRDFVALDVETASYDRASICQIGMVKVLGGKSSMSSPP